MSVNHDSALAPRNDELAAAQLPQVAPPSVEPIRLRRVVACMDTSPYADLVLAHAIRAVLAIDGELTLLRVIEPRYATLPDPVAFDLRGRSALDELATLAEEHSAGGREIRTAVIEGHAADQIRQWVKDNGIDLTVLATHGDRGINEWGMGSTARKLVDSVPGSLLLVPANGPRAREVSYRTILVPLDGSAHAESVLPLAARLVDHRQGKLVLAHIIPVPEMTETAPMESEARELRDRMVRRNRRVATEYLERVRLQVSRETVVRTLSQVADVRSGLSAILHDENPDLVVLSAYGRGRRADVPFGTVASYLMNRATIPLLVVRGRPAVAMQRDSGAVRLPANADGL